MSAETVDVAEKVTVEAIVEKLNLYDPRLVSSVNGIRVIDVGQGDCIGILNERDDVFCYVDYGGFDYHPDAGAAIPNPSANRMRADLYGSPVTIILTHWDKDHCWSASKKNTAALKCFWIVPRQYVAPSVAILAARLKNAKRWPESIADSSVELPVGPKHRVTIRKCSLFDKHDTNADRNLTGLAVSIVAEKEDGSDEVMLMPGDCPFDLIPSWESSSSIRALVAYHHGSSTHWTKHATDQAVQHWKPKSELIYSVGFNRFGTNGYGHPHKINYEPNWNTNSSTTWDARVKGELGIDIKW